MPHRPPDDPVAALSEILRTRRGQLAAVARGEGLAPEDAVDCVQEGLCTWLDLRETGGLDATGDPAATLFTIVRNAARNRRRRHFHARPHEGIAEREHTDDRAALPEELLARAEEYVRLRACVAELCEIQRAVVTLRMLEERPGEDVAAALDISPNHVAVLLHRAKHALRACMTGAGGA